MPYKSKEQQREYQRLWMVRRRQKYLAGRECELCGSSESLHVDHIEPSFKVSRRIWSWSEDRILEELSKCQILCASCHIQKTMIENNLAPSPHGSITRYRQHSCRCRICVDSEVGRVNDRRRRRIARIRTTTIGK